MGEHECEMPDTWRSDGIGPPPCTEWKCPVFGAEYELDVDFDRGVDGDEFEVRTWERKRFASGGVVTGTQGIPAALSEPGSPPYQLTRKESDALGSSDALRRMNEAVSMSAIEAVDKLGSDAGPVTTAEQFAEMNARANFKAERFVQEQRIRGELVERVQAAISSEACWAPDPDLGVDYPNLDAMADAAVSVFVEFLRPVIQL